MENPYPFVHPTNHSRADLIEVQEAERTNEQLCKVLEAVDSSANPSRMAPPNRETGGPYVCPFCDIVADHPYHIRHDEDCIVLVARQVMRDADMETSMDRYEKELKGNEELWN